MQKDKKLFERAIAIIPNQTMTMSKRYDQRASNSPAYITGGVGNYLYASDGKIYLDYICGLGTNILGYKKITTERGHSPCSYSLPTEKEVILAETLKDIIPCAEMVRLLKTGSEATSAAVRIARAYTKRTKILTIGYHGWMDTFNYKEPGYGTPGETKKLTHEIQYSREGDQTPFALLNSREYACLIMEPVMLENPSPGWLQKIREFCTNTGTVLIFDEIITGFWWGIGGYQKECGVIPDLATFGKGMGNGAPISAVVGKKEIMSCEYFVSSTFAGESLSIDFALATIAELKKADYLARNQKAELLFKELKKVTDIYGFPWRAAFPLNEKTSVFWQEMIKKQIIFGKPYWFNFAVTDAMLQRTVDSVKSVDMSVEYEGEMPRQVFDDGRKPK